MSKSHLIFRGKRLTLRAKAIIGSLVIVTLCIGVMSLFSIYQITKFATNEQDKTANSQIEGIALACQLPMNVGDYDEVQRILESVIANDTQIILCHVYDAEGVLVAEVFDVSSGQTTQSYDRESGQQRLTYEHDIEPMDMDLGLDIGYDFDSLELEVTQSSDEVIHSENKSVGRIELELSSSAIESARRSQVVSTLTIGTIFGLITIFIGSFIVKYELLRLDELVGAAEKLSQGDYSHKTPSLGHDEIGDLGRAFERMRAAVMLRGNQLEELNGSLLDMVEERTQELSVAVERAKEANSSKTDFLANMSHEIRTPMTAILGYTELLATEDLTAKERFEYIQTIQRNGNFLLSIINDILDITKIEAGKMSVERIECDLAVLIEEVMSLMRVRSQAKDIELKLRYTSDIPRYVMIDPLRTRQILTNLVGNAIKFTEQGHVEIVVSCDDLNGSIDAPLSIEIHDSGIGMNDEQLGRLFKAFQQADSTMTRRFGGSGLGLCICKSLASLQGGHVTVRSIPKSGSVFTLRLDPGVSESVGRYRVETSVEGHIHSCRIGEITTEPPLLKPLTGLRILLAEDGPDNQKLISHVLKKAGANMTIAENGRIAVDMFNEAQATDQPFDMILMDMQMPEMDGYTATKLLRKQGYATPIIALTAHAMSGDRKRCIDSGCDDYSTKPINRKELIKLCEYWGESKERRSA